MLTCAHAHTHRNIEIICLPKGCTPQGRKEARDTYDFVVFIKLILATEHLE
jgi:hypothetical protein